MISDRGTAGGNWCEAPNGIAHNENGFGGFSHDCADELCWACIRVRDCANVGCGCERVTSPAAGQGC